MSEYDDFEEVAHCGGRVTFHIVCDLQGNRSCSQRIQHDRPGPAAMVGIYALAPQGIPVADFAIGGIGQGFDPQPQPGWVPVFLGSDSRQCWGHQCPRCSGYFRNGTHAAIFPLTCPYCGLRTVAHRFLTAAQKAYVEHYVNTLLEGLDAEIVPGTEKNFVIDMDAVAAQGKDHPKPKFYYTSETQQTRYKCDHCGEFNDIRGRYGYCASCGWRNNAQSMKDSFASLRAKLNERQISAEDGVRAVVSEFDACCRDFVGQVIRRIPMKSARRTELDRLIFHDPEAKTISKIKAMFEIDLLRNVGEELNFLKMMMARRHVYEHNAGVADARYLVESGDKDTREGALIREAPENVHRFVNVVGRIVDNFDADFHEIFQPTEWPIKHYEEWQSRKRKPNRS